MEKSLIKIIISLLLLTPLSGYALVKRVNIDTNGVESNNQSMLGIMTPDAKYLLFQSNATNLVPNDTNNQQDCFIRDTVNNTTKTVNIAMNGAVGNGTSYCPFFINGITSNGRYIGFSSTSSDLVPGDTNGTIDTFIRDTVNNTTIRINVDSNGNQTTSSYNHNVYYISPDGRYAYFHSEATNLVPGDTNGWGDIFLRDTVLGTTSIVTLGDGGQLSNNNLMFSQVKITSDGRYVFFQTMANNLVPGDTNGQHDIFMRDTVNNTTTRVSVGNSGNEGNNQSWLEGISADGRFVLFSSTATNLVPGDTNGTWDVFVRDRLNNTTTRVNVSTQGAEANNFTRTAKISNDGRYVVFVTTSNTLVSNSINGQQNVFMRDILNNITTRVSTSFTGGAANSQSTLTDFTPDGKHILFTSWASNLVSNDTNGQQDIFIKNTINNSITRADVSNTEPQGTQSSDIKQISLNGRYVLFESWASNLVANDTNSTRDIFLYQSCPTEYSNPTNGFSFCFPNNFKSKNNINAGSLITTFTLTGQRYTLGKPLVNISQAVIPTSTNQQMSLYMMQNNAVNSFRRLMKNTLVTTIDIERTADGTPIKQMHFTGKIGGVTRTFVVAFIKRGIEIYVITANGDSQYNSELDEMVDTIISSRKFLQGEISCVSCLPPPPQGGDSE